MYSELPLEAAMYSRYDSDPASREAVECKTPSRHRPSMTDHTSYEGGGEILIIIHLMTIQDHKDFTPCWSNCVITTYIKNRCPSAKIKMGLSDIAVCPA